MLQGKGAMPRALRHGPPQLQRGISSLNQGGLKNPLETGLKILETAEEVTESSEPTGREAETSDLLERPGKGNPSVRDEVLKDHSSS